MITKEKGITLIALVVTIIILIILAAVSINIVFSEEGLAKRAKVAKERYDSYIQLLNEMRQGKRRY